MKKLVLFAALTAITAVHGQIDRSIRPAAAPAPSINIKNSEVFTLPNGITVVLSENHKLPKVSVNLVMGGTAKVEGDKAGLNQLMGQLLMSGTTSRSKDALDSEIDLIGASLTADGSSIFLSTLTKNLNGAMNIMKDVATNPAFPEDEFKRIVKMSESNLKSVMSSPDEMAANAERKINFPDNPNSNVMNETTLANITLDDIWKEYRTTFTPQGAYLVIVGDINRADAEKLAKTYFGDWNGGPMFGREFSKGGYVKGQRVIFVNKPGAVQSVISVTFPINLTPGAPEQIPVTVMNGIFGGSAFGARLMQNLREDKAYTYGAYSDLQVTREGSWVSASGSFRNEVTDSAITQMLLEFDKIATSYVTDEELALTKSAMAGSFARSLESPQTIARFALNIIRNKLPQDYYTNYLKRLDAVTKEDVLLMAQKYFKGGMNIIVVGDESVLSKIRQFDADGVIEKLDAFGNPVQETEKADITADQLISKYIQAITHTTSDKAAAKKIKAVKSMKQEIKMTSAMIPSELTAVDVFQAPNKDAQSIAMGKMVVQSSYFDGKKGSTTDMQNGTKELTADEIAAKLKSAGLIPEMAYKTSGMTYTLKGIETIGGKKYYVLETNDGTSKKFDYFDKETFLKYKSVSIQTVEGQTMEMARVYADYKDVNGIAFPHKMSQNIGELQLEGTVKTIEINGKIDPKMFE
jgi:zinc protease